MPFYPARTPHRCFLLLLCLLFLAGCQRPTTIPAPDGAGQPRPAETAPRGMPGATATPAPATAALPTATPLPMVDLVWYAQGPGPENTPAQMEALNRLLREHGLNARVEMRYIETGLFEQRMAEIRAAGQNWDLVSLSGAQYDLWQSQGLLLALPAEALPGPAWEALDRGGAYYAVPAPTAWARPRGVAIRADAVRALGLQADLESLRGFQDLTPLLEKIQSAIEDGTLKAAGIEDADALQRAAGSAAILFPEAGGYSRLWGPLVVSAEDAVSRWPQTAAFRQFADLRHAWQAAGFLPEAQQTPDQLLEGCREGLFVMEIGRQVYPGSAAKQAERCGYAWVDIALTPAWITTDAVLSAVTGVNARISDDPERARRAVLLLEQAQADAETFNLLAGLLGWEGGVSLEEMQRWNAAAKPAPGLGFVFDARPVGAEAAAVRGEAPEFLEPLSNGQSPDVERAVSALNRFLEAAGIERIQAELEAQYAEWRGGQP